jgi:hypothetical protein
MSSVVLVVDILKGFLVKGYLLIIGEDFRRINPEIQALQLLAKRGRNAGITPNSKLKRLMQYLY